MIMAKFKVHYLRVEHQMYSVEVEADTAAQAEQVAIDSFDGSEKYEVVHGEEYVDSVEEVASMEAQNAQ